MKTKDDKIKIGCCGFAMAQKEYFRHFKLVEIQQTFYKLPQLSTAKKWQEAAPQDFEFTMKAWQLITHEPSSPTYSRLGRVIDPSENEHYGGFRCTKEVLEAWECTAMVAYELGATHVVFQCPASFKPTEDNIENMRKFFSRIDRGSLLFNNKWMKDDALRFMELMKGGA